MFKHHYERFLALRNHFGRDGDSTGRDYCNGGRNSRQQPLTAESPLHTACRRPTAPCSSQRAPPPETVGRRQSQRKPQREPHMPAARLWCPLTRLARVWLNLCLEGCSLDVRGRTLAHDHPKDRRRRPLAALSSAMPTQVEAAVPRLVWASVASLRWPFFEGLFCSGALEGCSLGVRGHLTVPRTSPCTSCGCGRLICHAHIHSWCTKILDFAAVVQNSERIVPRCVFLE